MPKFRGSMINSDTCSRCNERRKLGFCNCSDHCINHDYSKVEDSPNYRKNLKERKLIATKVNKLRPNVVKYE